MKKRIIIAVLVLVLCLSVFAACNDTPAENTGLQAARDYVKGLYRDQAEITSSDYELTTSVVMSDGTYTVEWSILDKDGNATTAAVVGEAKDGKVTVTVDTELSEDVAYVLTATIKDASGNSMTLQFNHKVPKFQVLTFDQFVSAKDDDPVVVRGVVSGIISKSAYSNSNNCLYVNDTTGGYYVYNLTSDPVTDGIKIGDTVLVRGAKDTYNGTLEIVNASVTVEATNGAMPAAKDVTELYKAAAKANNLKDEKLVYPQAQLVTIKGVEITTQDESSGYYKFKLDGLESYVRISSSVCPMSKADIDTFKKGHAAHTGYTANVTGVVCVYNGAFYLTPVSVDAFEYVGLPERDPAGQVAYEKENLTLTSSALFDQEIVLPAKGTAYPDVAITWDFKAETAHTTATIADGKLNITLGEVAETITLVATLKQGEATDTKEFTIEVSSSTKDWKTAAWAIAEAKKLAAGATSEGWYYIYGEIVSDPTADYCNFNLTDGTDTLVVYGLYNQKGDKRYGSKRDIAELPVKKGDKVFLYAQIQNYASNGKVTYELVNARLQTPTNRDLYNVSVVKTPVADTEYKLAMWQNNKGEVYYATGAISGRYLSTTTDASKAAKVTVVAAQGGYYIKIGDKYLTITGEEYNNKLSTSSPTLTDAATTVFTIDANGVLVFTASATGYADGTFYLGASGTYTTIGASATSYISDATKIDVSQFVARLVAVEASSEGGEGGDSGSAGSDTPAGPITTIADAVNASEGATVQLSGTVSDITEAWSSYNNMSFYISDGTKKILVFRAGTKVVVGDIVSVSGTITIYSDKAQIAQGATVTVTTAHVCSSWTTATCEDASVCTTCGAEKSEALGHVDEDGDNICDRDDCGWILSAVKKSLTITGTTGTMGTKEITWTNDIVTVKNEQASSTTTIRNSDNDHFRAYKSSKLTISISSGTLVRIVVTCQNNGYATALKNSLTTTGATATVSGTTVVITVTGDISAVEFSMTEQIRITGVEVDYIAAE